MRPCAQIHLCPHAWSYMDIVVSKCDKKSSWENWKPFSNLLFPAICISYEFSACYFAISEIFPLHDYFSSKSGIPLSCIVHQPHFYILLLPLSVAVHSDTAGKVSTWVSQSSVRSHGIGSRIRFNPKKNPLIQSYGHTSSFLQKFLMLGTETKHFLEVFQYLGAKASICNNDWQAIVWKIEEYC